MTMHLMGPGYTTTRYSNKKKRKSNRKSLRDAEQAHDKFLKERGIHPEQLAARDRPKQRLSMNREANSFDKYASETVFEGAEGSNGSAKEAKQYTGERKLMGIATMHKSNMVPVFADQPEVAEEIAKMRRG